VKEVFLLISYILRRTEGRVWQRKYWPSNHIGPTKKAEIAVL
jgi:hypothetical protein